MDGFTQFVAIVILIVFSLFSIYEIWQQQTIGDSLKVAACCAAGGAVLVACSEIIASIISIFFAFAVAIGIIAALFS